MDMVLQDNHIKTRLEMFSKSFSDTMMIKVVILQLGLEILPHSIQVLAVSIRSTLQEFSKAMLHKPIGVLIPLTKMTFIEIIQGIS
jgi:hypothetical protein